MMKFFPWKRALHKKTIWFSGLVMLTLGLVAALAPFIAPHDPYTWAYSHSSLPPMWIQNTSNPGLADFPLGTDRYGRDILSRLIYGTRTSFFLALTAVPLAALLGTFIGLISGYASGRVDSVLTAFMDMIQSLPGIMFMVIIVLIFRSMLSPTWFNGLITLIIGFAAVSWVSLARLIRINVLHIMNQLYVEAAIGLGASPGDLILHHLLPNVLHVILVWIVNNIPAVILLEAVLGYIGVGVTNSVEGSEFTVVSWGGLFFAGRSVLSSNPLMLMIPSLCILLISMSFILLADFLNEATRHN
jgi:ABC-type dipeptide/oligopeptide/nickel transport system permease subunit